MPGMPDFSYLYANDFKFKEIDPYAAEKQRLTLRQLTDAREYQRAQLRHMQLQEQEAADKRQRARALQSLFWTGVKPTREQILAADAIGGMALIREMDAQDKEARLAESAGVEALTKKNAQQLAVNKAIANIGMQAAQIPLIDISPEDLKRGKLQPREEYFNQGVAGTLIDAGITPAEQFGAFPVPADQRAAEMYFAQVNGPDELRKYKAALEKDRQDKQIAALNIADKQWEQAGRMLGGVTGQPSWETFRSSLPVEMQAQISPRYSPPEAARVQNMMLTAQQRATEARQTMPNTPDELIFWMEQPERTPQEKEMGGSALNRMTTYHTAIRPNVVSAAPGLVDAVMQNPNLWDNLTPTAKTEIAPEIAKRGGGAIFGKPLSESAIGKLSDSRSAVAALRDLREVLKANEQYIGPVSGLQAINPYSDARKAQANIDMVRQRVGKALEGGVLRKEDEEKYRRILATLTDVPSTAIYKVDQLIGTLERDIETFTDEQKKAGRRVSSEPESPKPAPSEIPNPLLNAPSSSSGGVPKVGDMYQGSRVKKVTKVR